MGKGEGKNKGKGHEDSGKGKGDMVKGKGKSMSFGKGKGDMFKGTLDEEAKGEEMLEEAKRRIEAEPDKAAEAVDAIRDLAEQGSEVVG